MEIYPLIMAKMLLVSFLFSLQAGVVFDLLRAFRLLFSGYPKSIRLKKICEARLPVFGKTLCGGNNKKYNRFMKNAVIFFSDVFLFLYSAWGLMKINYSYNDGEIRAFTLIGFFLGAIAYYFLLSRVVAFILEAAVLLVKYALASVFTLITFPFFKIYNNFVKKIKKMLGKFHLRIEKKKEKVYNVNEIVCKNRDFESKSTKVRVSSSKKKRRGATENEEK